jgi:hypothetical protein
LVAMICSTLKINGSNHGCNPLLKQSQLSQDTM